MGGYDGLFAHPKMQLGAGREMRPRAVVEPRAFTTGLMRAAQAHGAVLWHGTVVDLVRGPSEAVRGVALANGEIIEGDPVVIAMGPWMLLFALGRWHGDEGIINERSKIHSMVTGAITFIAFIRENSLGNIDRCALLRLWILHIPDAWRGNGEPHHVRSMASHLQRLLSYHDRQFHTDAVGL